MPLLCSENIKILHLYRILSVLCSLIPASCSLLSCTAKPSQIKDSNIKIPAALSCFYFDGLQLDLTYCCCMTDSHTVIDPRAILFMKPFKDISLTALTFVKGMYWNSINTDWIRFTSRYFKILELHIGSQTCSCK